MGTKKISELPTGTLANADVVVGNTGGTTTGLSYDTTKLDGIEALADVTDVTNVTAAGALMDSELTSIADVKALDQSVISGASPTFAATNMTDGTDKNFISDAEAVVLGNTSGTNTGDEATASVTVSGILESATVAETDTGTDAIRHVTPASLAGSALQTKVDGVEASADVTDEANVTSSLDGATLTAVTVATGDKVLVQDLSDSDNLKSVTAQSLANLATPEGTAVLSTGEVGGTKYLREDGDGTCSWQTVAGGGSLSNVVEDTTPQLGGDLDLNGNQITSPDGTDLIDIPNGSIDLQTASTSRADITDSGIRLGAANARVTTILDEDAMGTDSATALCTQQSIKAYVDAAAAFIGVKARRTTAQTLTTSTWTKIQLATEDLDTEGDFDNATNYRHTPSIVGKWLYIWKASLVDPVADHRVITGIYKNGSISSSGLIHTSHANVIVTTYTALIEMNGSTDYAEGWLFHDKGSNANTDVGQYACEFAAIYLGT